MADDGWIEWDGSRCPVEAGTPLVVRYRDGGERHAKALEVDGSWRNAEARFWVTSDNHDSDIIAYRIVEQ